MVAIVILMGIGTVMIYSASIYIATQSMDSGTYYLERQLINVGVALGALILGMTLHYRKLREWVYPLLIVSLVLLVLLLTPLGHNVGKSTRWFRLSFLSFQPSELAKLAFIVWLAYSLEKKHGKLQNFAVGFLPHLLVMGLIMALCLAQPDFGTCMVLAAIMVLMLFVAGTKIGYILVLAFMAVPVFVKYVVLNEMRWARLVAFIDPWNVAHRWGAGYQTVNSLTAFGSGGVTGLGLGASRQKFGYIPEAQTDFIFPILGEELGLIGVVAVLGLFIFVVVRGISIATKASDDFGRYLAYGITMLIGIQAAVNIGVSLGLLPTKGLTLPFISFGGTSLVVIAFGVGVMLNISRRSFPPGAVPPPARAQAPGPSASTVKPRLRVGRMSS